MIAKIRKVFEMDLVQHFKNYMMNSVLTKIVSFISLPVLTRLMTPADYGVAYVFESYISIFSILLVFNLAGAVGRYVFEERDDTNEMVGTSFVLTFSLLAFWFAILIIFRHTLAGRMDLPPTVMWFYIPALAHAVIDSIFLQLFQAYQKSKLLMRINVIGSYVSLAMVILVVSNMQSDRYLGMLGVSAAYFSVLCFYKLYLLRDHIRFNVKKEHIRYILSFAVPSMPYLLSGTILAIFDRIMINTYYGSSDAGLYSFAYNIGMLQLLVSNAIHNSWTPRFYKLMNQGDVPAVNKDSKNIINVLAVSAIFLVLFASNIGSVLSADSFHSSLNFIPLIVIAHYLVGIDPLYNNFILYKKITYVRSIIVILGTVLNLLGNMWLLPYFGPIAAAYTTIFAYIFIFIANIVTSKYIFRFPTISPMEIAEPMLLIFLALAGYYAFNHFSIHYLSDLLLKTVLFIAFSFILLRKPLQQFLKTA